MAKEKLTVEQIRELLISRNPLKFGVNANPIVLQKTSFVLVGRMKTPAGGGDAKEQYMDITQLSDEAKKANPGLTTTRFIRIMKTDLVNETIKPGDVIHTARKPIADNLFERQQPMLFELLIRLLKDKNEDGSYKHFTKLEKDKAGNPQVKLTSPLLGAFITLNVPGYYKVDKDGKILMGSTKDISTNKFGDKKKQVFRSDVFFLAEHDIDRMEEIAIGRFQKLIEPMLAEEITVTLGEGGTVIKKDIVKDTVAADNVEIETENNTSADLGDDVV
jgi:hypothetical protein